MSRDSKQPQYQEVLSRRRVIAAAGASGIAALAGCTGTGNDGTANDGGDGGGGGGGDGGDGGSDGTSSNGGQVYDATYVNAWNGNPADLHFNSYSDQNYAWPAGNAVFAPFMKYSFSSSEFILGALSDVSVENQEVSLTFRDDLTWDNGDDWTTDDLEVQLELNKKVGSSLWGYIDGYELVDDKTATLQLSGPTNPQIIKFELSNWLVDTKASVHGEYVDSPLEDLLGWAWEDPVASGRFSFVSKDQQAFEFERNEEFYNADKINFETYLIEQYGGNNAQHQALLSGQEVDAAVSLFTPPEIAKKFADNVGEVRVPAKWGYGMVFNHDDEHFGKREVRQAVAHVVNRQALVDNAGPKTKKPAPIPCGVAPEDQQNWLGDWYDAFETYGVDSSQTKKAASLLEDAGYSKKNGKWRDGDGNTLGGNYYTPAGWTDWTTLTQTVVSQLNDFGFDFSVATKPTNDWFGQYSNGDFKAGAFYWLPGGAKSSFPYFPLQYQLQGTDFNGGHGYRPIAKSEQTVPGPDGGDLSLVPLEEANKIAQQSSNEDAMEYVQRSAWYNHVDLPFLSLVTKFDQSWVTTDEWTAPSKDSKNHAVKWPQDWWAHQGELQYKG